MTNNSSKLKEKRIALAFGGLLHDIGALISKTDKIKNWFKGCNSVDCYAVEFFNEYLAPFLNPAFASLVKEAFNVKSSGAIAKLYRCVEQVASAELGGKHNFANKNVLKSVFERVVIGRRLNSLEGKWFYKPQPLELTADSLAVEWKQILFPTTEWEYTISYDRLVEEFINSLNLWLRVVPFEGSLAPQKLLSRLYHLMYKYFWSIPVGQGIYSDISLFDHSRTVAALASAIFTTEHINLLKTNSCNGTLRKKFKVLLLEGDLSGIQAFIFGVASSEGVSKRLRGRSFFLSLLPELVARFILNQLGYPFINVLYASAGKFQILLGYEEGIELKLKLIENDIEELFLKNFGGDLVPVIAWEPFALSELEKPAASTFSEKLSGYTDIVRRLHDKLSDKKKKKFASALERAEEFFIEDYKKLLENAEGLELCRSCRRRFVEQKGPSEGICDQCEAFRKLGELLTKRSLVAFYTDPKTSLPKVVEKTTDATLRCKGFQLTDSGDIVSGNPILGFEILNPWELTLTKFNTADEILILNNTNFDRMEGEFSHLSFITGFRFVGNTVPIITAQVFEKYRTLLGRFKELDQHFNLGNKEVVAPFEFIAYLSDGDKKLSYMKLDVDNLGLIFIKGLKELPYGEKSIELYTMSRIATLSRMLDLFFSGYINALLKEFKPPIEGIDSALYTVFAGGDDLWIIGPWDKTVEFALVLREQFYNYTCQNPDLGTSATLSFFKHSYPIRLAAEILEKEEMQAKKTLLELACNLQNPQCLDKLDQLLQGKIIEREKLRKVCGEFALELEKRFGSPQRLIEDYQYPPLYYLKDRVAIFGESFDWQTFGEIKQLGDSLVNLVKDKIISRRLIYTFYTLLKAVKNAPEIKKSTLELKFFPTFYYLLARNVPDINCPQNSAENCQRMLEEVVIDRNNRYQLRLKFAMAVFAYALMKTRNKV